MTIYILKDTKSSHLATSFYVDYVCNKLGFKTLVHVNSPHDIPNGSWIFLYQSKDLFKSLFTKKKLKTLTWFQGVLPEEALLIKKSTLRYYAWCFLEKIALKKSDWCLFVSDAMRFHYRSKYNYVNNNFSIAPCINRLNPNCSDFKNLFWTTRPEFSFIYAGSTHDWQCIREMLTIFNHIKKNVCESATLVFVTENIVETENSLFREDVSNIKFISLSGEKLDCELKKHRFGFLLRRDSNINHVATPTKMSTYLSSGVMPIVTDAVDIFKDLKLGEHNLAFESKLIDQPAAFCNHLLEIVSVNNIDLEIKNLISEYFMKINSYFYKLNSPLKKKFD